MAKLNLSSHLLELYKEMYAQTLPKTGSLRSQFVIQKQDSSSNDVIGNNFNVDFVKYNLLRKHSRFKKTGTRTSFTFSESPCSTVIRHFIFTADQFNIQLSFSQYIFVSLSVMDPLTSEGLTMTFGSVCPDLWIS